MSFYTPFETLKPKSEEDPDTLSSASNLALALLEQEGVFGSFGVCRRWFRTHGKILKEVQG